MAADLWARLLRLLLKLILWFGHQFHWLLESVIKRWTQTLTTALKNISSLLMVSKMWHTLWINPINLFPRRIYSVLRWRSSSESQSLDSKQAVPQLPCSQNELLWEQVVPASNWGGRKATDELFQVLSKPFPFPPGLTAVAPSKGRKPVGAEAGDRPLRRPRPQAAPWRRRLGPPARMTSSGRLGIDPSRWATRALLRGHCHRSRPTRWGGTLALPRTEQVYIKIHRCRHAAHWQFCAGFGLNAEKPLYCLRRERQGSQGEAAVPARPRGTYALPEPRYFLRSPPWLRG